MKSMLITLTVLALSLAATAGNEGPQAIPQKPTDVVAEYRANGGFFVPPNLPSSHHYKILTNRKAIVVSYTRNKQNPETQVLKTLTAAEMRQLTTLISQIKEGALYDPNPNQPGCHDAPSFTWLVYKQFGKTEIAQKQRCKMMARKNSGPADQKVVEILNQIAALRK